jgi:hypothetical protein
VKTFGYACKIYHEQKIKVLQETIHIPTVVVKEVKQHELSQDYPTQSDVAA